VEPNHNLVLTGFMGTGKTTVGRRVADRLGREFVDTDRLIEDRHGPIAAIFAEQGESAFREMERSLAVELGGRSGLVIATGGRMMLDPEAFAALSRNGRIFCLVATPEEIHRRVGDDPDRPLLRTGDSRERIVELLTARSPEYDRFPKVATDRIDPDDVARELVDIWGAHSHVEAGGPLGGSGYTVGAGILPFVRRIASVDGPVVLLTDEAVHDRYGPAIGDCDLTIRLPAHGLEKTIDTARIVYEQMLRAGVGRSATLVSLGGTTVVDLAGFVAATYQRGIDLVHCPTDLVGMIDTGIGGRVGLDLPQGRDLVGLHKPPTAVVADVATLQSLPAGELRSGLAEAIKHGLLGSSELLADLGRPSWGEGARRTPEALADLRSLVAVAIEVKLSILRADPFEESGLRTVLDLGRTFASSLERLSSGQLDHGAAMGTGLVAAARLSEMRGAGPALADRVERLVSHVGLGTTIPAGITPREIVEAMTRPGGACPAGFVLLHDVGEPFIADDVRPDELMTVLAGMAG
jgi:3-dehydroquinate synthetase/shikimate kinase